MAEPPTSSIVKTRCRPGSDPLGRYARLQRATAV